MKNSLAAAAILFCSAVCSFAQGSNSAITQVLVGVDAQSGRAPAQSDVILKVNGKPQPLTGWSRVPPDQLQIAVLIDDNRLKRDVGDHLDSLQNFAMALPAGAQIYIGYMGDGGIHTEQGFTNDHAYAAARFRRPSGITEVTPSPFTCLSTLVKAWAVERSHLAARVVLLLSDGVDYRPDFAAKAVEDAQRAGVVVFSIYPQHAPPPSYWNARQGLFSDSPFDSLDEVTGGTGGHAYYEPNGDQRSLADYLDRFRIALANMYVASFTAPLSGSKLLQLKMETKLPGVKLTAPKAILPGNIEVSGVQ